jgi:hypothetical protein
MPTVEEEVRQPTTSVIESLGNPLKSTTTSSSSAPLSSSNTSQHVPNTPMNDVYDHIQTKRNFAADVLGSVPVALPLTSEEEPSPTALEKTVKSIKNRTFSKGELVNLVSASWLNTFIAYAENPMHVTAPGKLDNSDLLLGDGMHNCVTIAVFEQLTKWYV